MECEISMRALLERMLLNASMEPIKLPLSLLKDITKNFSDDQLIGSGGFASVYKGLLQNGTVAVKKLSNIDLDELDFLQELQSLIRVKHMNIVRFLGYCADTQGELLTHQGRHILAEERQRLLCFEFLPEGSLRKHITDASRGLEWRTRYHIIKGICEGLNYLHEQDIVHSDLKPENILLDDYRIPKIADFGLSKCFDKGQSRFTTDKPPVGTLGYMAPEILSGTTTFKSDIYSLGILIIEILTGQKGCPEIENELKNWSTRFGTSQGSTELLEHVRFCAEIGKECTNFDPTKRPDTWSIIERLDEMERTYGFIETDLCPSATQVRSLGPCEASNNKLLDIHPVELHFPFERSKRTECAMTLTNRTDHHIGVWITPVEHHRFVAPSFKDKTE